MGRIPTVTIKSDNEKGRKIINESDFDESIHELYKPSKQELKEQEQPKKEAKEKDKKPESKGSFVKREVSAGWFNVFDKDGNQVSEKNLREKEADKLLEDLG